MTFDPTPAADAYSSIVRTDSLYHGGMIVVGALFKVLLHQMMTQYHVTESAATQSLSAVTTGFMFYQGSLFAASGMVGLARYGLQNFVYSFSKNLADKNFLGAGNVVLSTLRDEAEKIIETSQNFNRMIADLHTVNPKDLDPLENNQDQRILP
jgi:uncharacterized membrane protein